MKCSTCGSSYDDEGCPRCNSSGTFNYGDWFIVAVMALLLALAILCSGCVTEHKQVLIKSTVFGLQIGTSPASAAIPQIQFGLIRNTYLSNPTSTNQVFAAPLTSDVQADIGLTRQMANETIIIR